MLNGCDRETGLPLKGPERARQSIATTISTPFRSQPGMRSFGNPIPDLISSPLTEDTIMEVYAGIIDAFTWEPEAELVRYGLTEADETGRVGIAYIARFTPTNEIFTDIIARAESLFDPAEILEI